MSVPFDEDTVVRGTWQFKDNWSHTTAEVYNPEKPWMRCPLWDMFKKAWEERVQVAVELDDTPVAKGDQVVALEDGTVSTESSDQTKASELGRAGSYGARGSSWEQCLLEPRSSKRVVIGSRHTALRKDATNCAQRRRSEPVAGLETSKYDVRWPEAQALSVGQKRWRAADLTRDVSVDVSRPPYAKGRGHGSESCVRSLTFPGTDREKKHESVAHFHDIHDRLSRHHYLQH